MSRLAAEAIALDDEGGWILAEDVVAARALPERDNSAMDGCATASEHDDIRHGITGPRPITSGQATIQQPR